MAKGPDLEVVNRALMLQVRELMDELKEADRENRRLRSELAAAQRDADLERGRS